MSAKYFDKCSILTAIAGVIFLLLLSPVYGQSLLKEMALADISQEQDVRITVIRDQLRSALVIRTAIADLQVRSNNIIFSTNDSSLGRLVIILAPGTHRLTFEAEGFVSASQRVFFEAREVKGFSVEALKSSSSLLRINSSPQEAEVLLEGVEQGETPLEIEDLAPGKYTLLIRKPGFKSYLSPVEVRAGEEHVVFTALENEIAYPLQITTLPNSASVAINNIAYGQTPFEQQFPVGDTLNITLRMVDYQNIERTIVMNQPQQIEIDFDKESTAISHEGSRKWLYWTAGGAATVAGAIAAMVLMGGEDLPQETDGIGKPGFPGEQ